jgi:hypothetical protein
VAKSHGLTMDRHPFFMVAKMVRKLRICQVTYSMIELKDNYEPLANFLLHDGGDFHNTFTLGSTMVEVENIKNISMFLAKTVIIKVKYEIFGCSTRFIRGKSSFNFSSAIDSDPCVANITKIKLVSIMLSCLKHMSKYKGYEAQFGVIDNLYKVGCDNFIVAKSPTIHEILHMQPPNDLILVDLSQLSDLPLIFGIGGIGDSTINGIP